MGSHRIVLAVAVLMLAACQVPVDATRAELPADAEPGEIRFELAKPNEAAIVVPVMIGEAGPYQFVVDTGATITCLAESLAAELELPERKGVMGVGATVSSSGSLRLVEIESLSIGSTRATNVTACTIDLSQLQNVGLEADGLLGLNVLKNYRVTIDFDKRMMRLDPRT
jgi:predicted aspartyl protease